jgi:hypothetical protein
MHMNFMTMNIINMEGAWTQTRTWTGALTQTNIDMDTYIDMDVDKDKNIFNHTEMPKCKLSDIQPVRLWNEKN